ncbi:MAG: DUF1559 domain-containing protein [Armatimonadota bacterium]|nr:DUF1559 domain-containing protein [Armatimonadota bacterium]
MENNAAPEKRGMSGWTIALIACSGCLVLAIVVGAIGAAILFPVFAKAKESAKKSACQSNMRMIALAFSMYSADYNDMLPVAPKGVTDDIFETTIGSLHAGQPAESYATAVYVYTKDASIFMCPSDNGGTSSFSYHYKRAVHKAAKAGLKNQDFNFPAEQVLIYETGSYHGGRGPLANGASLNIAFIDGHVKTHRMVDVANDTEPLYFNTVDSSNPKAAKLKKPYWDPRYCYDTLR